MTRDREPPDTGDDTGDDLRLGPIPAPDASPDGAEQARARAFGDLVDKVMAGRTPAAVRAEDRALLEVATVIRAAVHPPELAPGQRRSLVESALATAIERRGGGARVTDPSVPVPGVIPIARARWRRSLPWLVAGVSGAVAAAAVALLVICRAPAAPTPAPTATAPVPAQLRSRPADPLIGAISREASGDAAARLDTIYADRLSGYRERTLSGARRPRPQRAGGPR